MPPSPARDSVQIAELTRRAEELVKSRDSLTASLNAKRDELQAALSGFASEKAALTARVSQLSAKNDELTASANSLSARLSEATAQITALTARNQDLTQSRDTLSASLNAKKDELQASVARLNAEKNELVTKTSQLAAKNDELTASLSRLSGQLSEANAQITTLTAANAQLTRSRDSLSASLNAKSDEYQSSLAALTAEKERLAAQVARLSARNDELDAAVNEQARRLADAAEQLRRQLKVQIDRGELDIIQFRDVLIVNIKDSIAFDPDSPTLRPEFGPILRKVSDVFAGFPDKVIRVEGHTAVAPSRWSSSWDLGAARAAGVVRFLQEKAGVDPTRLVALSFGEYRPLAPNTNEDSRRKNRRVELVLVERPLYQVQELIQSGAKK